MNWLSHILISKNAIEHQLGNLLADPLKGKPWDGASDLLIEGFKIHGQIDSFTDANKNVLASKSRLGSKGYLKGIVIDITYDYLLLKNWNNYCAVSADTFIYNFYKNAKFTIEAYPINVKAFINRLIEYKILTSYSTFEGVKTALERIDYRLSPKLSEKETTSSYIPIIQRNIGLIENDFYNFFPQLVTHFKPLIDHNPNNHWLK